MVGARAQGWSKIRNVCHLTQWRFLKDARWRRVPTGAGLVDGGGRPRASAPGKGWGGGWRKFVCRTFVVALWGGEGVPTRAGLVLAG